MKVLVTKKKGGKRRLCVVEVEEAICFGVNAGVFGEVSKGGIALDGVEGIGGIQRDNYFSGVERSLYSVKSELTSTFTVKGVGAVGNVLILREIFEDEEPASFDDGVDDGDRSDLGGLGFVRKWGQRGRRKEVGFRGMKC